MKLQRLTSALYLHSHAASHAKSAVVGRSRRRGMKILLSLWLLLAPALSAHAQAPATFLEQCTGQVNDRMSQQQRLYRRNLFGLTRANTAVIGDVRFDTTGIPWLKVAQNRWQSQAVGMRGITKSDGEMDGMVERDLLNPSDDRTFRLGIFATRGVLTSALVPSLTQNFRALQCRTEAVCIAAQRALSGAMDATQTMMVSTPGCRQIPVPAMPLCRSSAGVTVGNDAAIYSYCRSVAQGVIDHEAAMLKFSVAYDAAYRSMLQFSGTFDDFLTVFRSDLLLPIEQAQSLLPQLSRIPCFLATCHE